MSLSAPANSFISSKRGELPDCLGAAASIRTFVRFFAVRRHEFFIGFSAFLFPIYFPTSKWYYQTGTKNLFRAKRMQVSLHEAATQLAVLGKKAWAGERIIIAQDGEPYLELIPHQK